ncbi:hypothetical protein PCANC_16147 [Puccinia coronata f. sp. avenae]|uniref:Uncharacterized protein n=1 Tax=Puccinia coronata f. sp. avenae TaxID=200324 RepID=A0A2N5T121_9BASI|nr:hypothetical protein PCANC_16147 [Puccinia coronata f. sp. avenae]
MSPASSDDHKSPSAHRLAAQSNPGCRIISADQSGAKMNSVRNDCVTPTDDNIEENCEKHPMTKKLRSMKQSHEEKPIPLANRITPRTTPNISLATRIKRRLNE